jgi:hypothetical protein
MEGFHKKIIEQLPEMITKTDHIRISIDYSEVTEYELENDLIEEPHGENCYKKYRPSDYRKGIK